MFYVGGVQQKPYFYLCALYGGCGGIGHVKLFEELVPLRYRLRISTGVTLKIWGGQ